LRADHLVDDLAFGKIVCDTRILRVTYGRDIRAPWPNCRRMKVRREQEQKEKGRHGLILQICHQGEYLWCHANAEGVNQGVRDLDRIQADLDR